MSVAAVSKVWKRSRAGGSELLVLLAIADYAYDDGRDAFPSLQKLAEKSRMSERGVRKIVRRLERMGELATEKNVAGREVRDGHRPRQFFHVLCCCDPEQRSGSGGQAKAEQRSGKAEQRSGSEGEQRAGQQEQCSASGERPTGTSGYVSPEQTGTRNKEYPSVSVKKKNPSRTREGRGSHPLDESPSVILPEWSLLFFDQIWELYPRKDKRLGAMRAWHALNPSQELAGFIVEHIRVRAALAWRETPLTYIPFLENFLADERWNDRYEAPLPAKAGPSKPSEDGRTVWRTCRCGDVVEGVVRGGEKVFPACPKCAGEAQEAVH